jgi:hypothetical protein
MKTCNNLNNIPLANDLVNDDISDLAGTSSDQNCERFIQVPQAAIDNFL